MNAPRRVPLANGPRIAPSDRDVLYNGDNIAKIDFSCINSRDVNAGPNLLFFFFVQFTASTPRLTHPRAAMIPASVVTVETHAHVRGRDS